MPWKVDTSHSSITFGVKHMIFSTFRGRFDRFEADVSVDEGDIANSSAVVRVDPASFHTGIQRFDGHVQGPDFFDTATHPKVLFETRSIERRDGAKVRVLGVLTLKGIEREIALDGELHGPLTDSFGGVRAGLSVEGLINREDFGMTWNLPFGEGGVYLGRDVRLNVELEVVKAQD